MGPIAASQDDDFGATALSSLLRSPSWRDASGRQPESRSRQEVGQAGYLAREAGSQVSLTRSLSFAAVLASCRRSCELTAWRES